MMFRCKLYVSGLEMEKMMEKEESEVVGGWDGGIVHLMLRLVGSGVKEMDFGLL